MATIDSQIPLVDRVHELEELKNHLTNATQGQGNLVFIAGEAGVGKTRLVDELKTYAQSQGMQILQGWSLYESLTPYMPFVEALRSANLDYLFSREGPPKVECVYLITDTGLLIKDVAREETKLDSIIFAGMLTAVGDFVKDSLTMLSGEERKETLDTLGYEKYRILIERGSNTNLVVILTGRENEFLVNDMREVLANVSQDYGNVLKAWDGDDNSVKGIDNLLKSLITSGKYDGIDYAKDDPKIKRNRLFENILLGITKHSKINPSLLCIEDLQWADPSSLALMHYVARNTRKCNLLILGTYRPEDVSLTKEGKAHHLIDTMQLMNREDLYQQIKLGRLEEGHIEEMLTSLLGNINFTDEFKKQLHKETEGNPFFIGELVRMLIEEKTIEKKDDIWMLTKDLKEANIPSKVQDVIARRLIWVKEEGREILDYAAVIGEEFTSDILAYATELDKVHLLKQLRTLEQKHKLIRSFQTIYKFDHAKIKEVLYSQIPAELRMEYHALIADAIETMNKDDLDKVIGDLAFHYYRCTNREKAILYLIKAAEKAKKDYSNEETIKFYTQALELEEDVQKKIEIFEAMGDIYELIGYIDKSIESYRNALGLIERKRKMAEIMAKIGRNYQRKFEIDESLKICTEALELVKDEECEEEAFVIHYIANVHVWRGEFDGGLEHHKKSLGIREKIGDQRGIAYSHHNIGCVHYYREDYDRALRHFEKGVEVSDGIGDLQIFGLCLDKIGSTYYIREEYDKALEHLQKCLEITGKSGSQVVMATVYGIISEIYIKKKNLKKALDFCNQASDLSERIGAKECLAYSRRARGMIYREQKRWKESIENFEKAVKTLKVIGDETILGWHLYQIGVTYNEFGLMWKEKGDADKAKTYLNETIDIYKKLKLKREVEKVRAVLELL